MPSVIPFRGDYGFHNSLSALKRIQEDMHLHAHNIANLNTEGFDPNKSNVSQTMKDDVVSLSEGQANSSRVNLEDEVSKMKEDEVYYKANAKTLKVQNDTMGSLLDLKA
jgi:flagellar hook protein FlgE